MAWVWVSKIYNKYTGQTINLIVPFGFTYTGSQMGTQVHEYSRYNQAHPEYELDVKAMYMQLANPQFCGADKVGTSFNFSGNGGGLHVDIAQRQSFRNEVTGWIKNMSGTTISSWYQLATADYAPNSPYRTDYVTSGFCAVINEEEQKMYFGVCRCQHTTDSSDPYYYSWAATVYMNDYSNNNVYSIFRGMMPSGGGDDPYGNDDYDEPSGGNGGHDDTSDTVNESTLPSVTASASGFVTAFVPTTQQINDLANYLISPTFKQFLEQTTVFNGFSDAILGLQVFPCTISADTPEYLYFFTPGLPHKTTVQMGKASNQFIEVPCGSLEVEEYWGNCCDYNPYTSISIFLPFCGSYDLDTDDVMGKTLTVSYRIDIMSGACLATIKVDGSVMYQYSGNCAAQIPLTSSSFVELFKGLVELGTATATGGAGLIAAGSAAEVGTARAAEISKKNQSLGSAMAQSASDTYDSAKVNYGSSLIGCTLANVLGSKGHYKHAGALGSSVGFLGVRTPYLIIKRPHQLIPSMYGKFHGYPCFTTANLNDITGYTVVEDIRLNIPDATVEEIIECEKLLKEGVVL